ncbi:MAG: glycogen/starch synthase [Paludibacteraceae bacterium]|nr:glycogen/starch synthase [Paludibacteraceae bacterium]
MQPEYIFETSWEVCNRVGGIYAVLSTRAASMQKEHKDKVIFFGPDFGDHSNLTFKESKTLLKGWRPQGVRVGRWQVPGKPIAVLLKWDEVWAHKNEIYGHAWEKYGVQSHAAYGDYDESNMFAHAVGQLAESLYNHLGQPSTVMHCNEWQTAFTILYLKEHCPKIATLFTTHATGIGRSIAGNYKPLYDCFYAFNGDQMAQELNMVSKHSVEKTAAHQADCFTTVSDLTARECAKLLDKPVDIVTPNGFEQGFVPQGKEFDAARKRARNTLISLARAKGIDAKATDMLIGTAGRYEWKNKGIDVFIESLTRLGEIQQRSGLTAQGGLTSNSASGLKKVIAFVMIPYLEREDFTVGNVHVIFVPTYLNGNDGVLNLPYYDLLIGLDLTIFPSYYEPWGYTPLESMAFHVPTITTSLSGYGVWCEEQGCTTIDKGVAVIYRNDSNTDDVINHIVNTIEYYLSLTPRKVAAARKAAVDLALQAEWKNFFTYYREAYSIALKKAAARQ